MVGIVAECSRHMLSLINDVLDFERMGANQMKIESIPFDIKEELRKMTKVRFSDCDLSHRACVTKR
jgi:signal transduction histidine kinase